MSTNKLFKGTILTIIYFVGGILALATISTVLNIFFIQPVKLDKPLVKYPAEAYVLATKSINTDSVKEGEIVTFTSSNNPDLLKIGEVSFVDDRSVIIDDQAVDLNQLKGKMLFCYYNCSN